MPWSYSQTSGELSHDGILVGTGYSGFGPGLDNPDLQDVQNVGPIPQGLWTIGPAEDRPGTLGPCVMPLTPYDGTDTFDRSGFYIHGNSSAHPEGASHGCIVMGPDIREQVAESGDPLLEVTI